jgi:hypothetical protein
VDGIGRWFERSFCSSFVPVAGLQEGSFGVLAITGRGKFSRGVAGGLRVFTLSRCVVVCAWKNTN